MSGSKDVKGTEKNNNGSNNGATEFFEFAEKMGEEFTENMSKLTEQWNGQWSSQWGDQMPDWYNSWINELPESFTQDAAKPGTFDLRKNLEDMTGGFGAAALPKIDTAKVLEAQFELLQNYQTLWMNTTAALMQTATGAENDDDESETQEVISPNAGDYRFKDSEWSENPVFSFIKQSYLLNAHWLRQMIDQTEGVDESTRMKIEFYSRMMVDAMSPTNFALTNPAVLREMQETNGQSIIQGITNYLEDQKAGFDGMRPRHTDMSAFKVGENVATAEGSVIFETPMMQLLQFSPTTDEVYKKPLMIVPPWINKFYILDLSEKNSFIRWAVNQGYTVFVISWVNPDESYADKSFDDYVKDGIFAALGAIEEATGEKQVTAIGYCIGGTMLAAALAHMAEHNDDRISAVTYFAAQVDFEKAGELLVFTDEQQISQLEPRVREQGYLDGGSMAGTFNSLRANDLIWHFVINNYLMGKQPPVFDLLYWNADSTRFPAQLLLDYLRNMYQKNLLSQPGGFTLLGEPVDLSKISIPTYIQASKEDHIAPAESVYKAANLYSGPVKFMLAGSGHIAGVINPPAAKKYQHWTNTKKKSYGEFEEWFADAKEHPGSWWQDWDKWLSKLSGDKVKARVPGEGKLKTIEAAPGSYVKVRS